MIEAMLINQSFRTPVMRFNKGDVFISSPDMRQAFTDAIYKHARLKNNPNALNAIEFFNFDSIFRKATKDGDFKNLVIIRYGGIGDLIALTSIIDYFNDCNIHFITQERYFPIFDWFVEKPKLYSLTKPILFNFKKSDITYKYSNWARYHGEGLIENGHNQNWFELFFNFIGETKPDLDMLRPQLRVDRISNDISNIQLLNTGKKSLLICNKSTIMMRTCHASDIIESLPIGISDIYDIFVYENNLSPADLNSLKHKVMLISKTDLKTFLLDCYDADMVISVDTGAIHFREGINKPAIGLYNSFTTESRTKYYQYTKSFDIKSECELQPCFIHERKNIKFCPKGNVGMFAAPCFSSDYNKTLINQLKEIFYETI